MKIAGHGLHIDVPRGWEARVYRRVEGDPTLHAGNFPAFQIIIEGFFRAPIARKLAQLFNNETTHVRARTLLIGRVSSVVANEWIGHRDNLTTVGWVGQHLLITGHRGVEADFPHFRSARTK